MFSLCLLSNDLCRKILDAAGGGGGNGGMRNIGSFCLEIPLSFYVPSSRNRHLILIQMMMVMMILVDGFGDGNKCFSMMTGFIIKEEMS